MIDFLSYILYNEAGVSIEGSRKHTRFFNLGEIAVEIVYSINGVAIRLTDERWEHIVSNKPYMYAYDDAILKAIETPTFVLRGYAGSLIAVLTLAKERYLHVVYKEVDQEDGFIITAYMAQKYNRSMIIWPRKS